MAIFSGKTENEAVEKGLKELGIDKKHADIKVLHEASNGIFGAFAREAEVEIIPLSDEDIKKRNFKKSLKIIGCVAAAVAFIAFISIAAIFSDSSPKDVTSMLSAPADSKDLVGKNYKSVVNQLKGAGFTNVKEEKIEDLITGLLTKDGAVEEVLIGGENDFHKGQSFEKDEPVVVSYHTFSEEPAETSSSSSVAASTSTTSSSSQSNTASEPATTSNQTSPITAENNAEFAAILNSDSSQLAREFVQKYKGKVIEFDGHVAYLANSGNYSTIYDILIYGGDWIDENTTNYSGVNFQFYNVQTTSEPFSSLDGLSLGQNIHIKAVVLEYTAGDLLRLEPVEITAR